MFRLIFFLPVFCLLQNSFARPQTTTEMTGIFFEYTPPAAKVDNILFNARLEPTTGYNVTVAQFMHHLRHTTYASAFMTEIFTLGKGIHLFTNNLMDNPSDKDRRIAYAVGKLWTTLTGMQTINRLTLRISNETSLRYLRNEDRKGTLKFAFSQLNDAILADSTVNQTYAEVMNNLDDSSLPPLVFVNINLKNLLSIDETLIEKVWPNSTCFDLVAHARFSAHLETKVEDAPGHDYADVLTAHVLVDAASIPAYKEMTQKFYEKAIEQVVENSVMFLQLTNKGYFEFDDAMFRSIDVMLAYPEYSKLEAKLARLRKNYPPPPQPES